MKIDTHQISSWMAKFNLRDLLLLIQTTAVHPSNQIYQSRFEFLLGILFSISPQSFAGARLSIDEFKKFITESYERYSSTFSIFEDFEPFSQRNLIPYFYTRSKKYFFYGSCERPYEFLRQFDNFYAIQESQETCTELVQIGQLLETSLNFQTSLLNKIFKSEEAKLRSDQIYIPSQQFIDNISPLFSIGGYTLSTISNIPTIEPGTFISEQVFDKCVNGYLFNTFRIHFPNNQNYFLLPQLHIEILYNIACKIASDSSNKDLILSTIYKNFISRLKKKYTQFFTLPHVIVQILQKGTNRNLAASLDGLAWVDSDKIFLFKTALHSLGNDLTEVINKAYKELESAIETIKKEKVIGLHLFDNRVIGISVNEIEFWPIVVFEGLNLTYKSSLPEKMYRNTLVINMMDLQALFEFLPTQMSFIKYLRADSYLTNKVRVICTDYLDRFAYYIENGESYPKIGIPTNVMVFEPHQWHDFYHAKLHERYQDNIYELIEYEYPKEFNLVKKHRDNIYQVLNTAVLNGGLVIKHESHLIWIMYPVNGYYHSHDDVLPVSQFIGPLIADYLHDLKESLFELFAKYNFKFGSSYYIGLYPASLVVKTHEPPFVEKYVNQLNENKPLLINTHYINGSMNMRSAILFDYTLLVKIFAPKENLGERYVIKELIKSIICFADKTISDSVAEKEAGKFVNENIPIREKGYSLEAISVENPYIQRYGHFIKISKADVGIIDSEIANFLRQQNIVPGKYAGDDAKNINNLVFQFLQQKLENEIKKYDESLLFYAYNQIEFAEGHREKDRLKFKVDARKYTEYDIVQKNLESMIEVSKIASSAKYIVETILKVNPMGNISINQEAWHYLQAIAFRLIETTIMSDHIHHDLIPYNVSINNLFQIKHMDEEKLFSPQEFQLAESQQQVEGWKTSYRNYQTKSAKTNGEKKESKEPFPYFLEMNEAFQAQLGFPLDSLFAILYAFGRMDICSNEFFPLTKIQPSVLEREFVKCTQNKYTRKEFHNTIDFLSLAFDTYDPTDPLLPLQLLRWKERINLCPIVHLPTGEYLYGNQMCLHALDIWIISITSGFFPYEIEKGSQITSVLEKIHRHRDQTLERKVETIAKQALGQDNVEGRIDNFRRISKSFLSKPQCGEIDVLAVNRKLKIIFVLEAKHLNKRLSPYYIRKEMNKFFCAEKSYYEKLVKKQQFIRNNIKEALKHFKIHDSTDWQVNKTFVVNDNYPSAFRKDRPVDFVLIDKLSKHLLNPGSNQS